MLNKVMLIGNIGQTPELSHTANSNAVCKCSLATSEKWTDKDGNKREATEWHNLVFWGKQAETANKYLHKGSKVYIEGKLKTNSWEKDGRKFYKTEIQVKEFLFMDSKSTGEKTQSNSPYQRSKPAEVPQDFGGSMDGDLPF